MTPTTVATEVGLEKARVHDLRYTFGQRLRDGGVSEEDQALLLGHAIEGNAAALRDCDDGQAGRSSQQGTFDRTTLLQVVIG